jgi:N-hydroxyarylamine O-acetyltransferase
MWMQDNREPKLPPALVERVLAALDFSYWPSPDLAGLNCLFSAVCAKIPSDNIQKRIWFASERMRPLPGGEPVEFFDNWLTHGTGGTCFPINGGLLVLLQAVGFDARRILGSVDNGGDDLDGNHGSVLVRLDGVDHLVDAQIASFKSLPLRSGEPASTGDGIHDISAAPMGDAFVISFYPGPRRDRPLTLTTQPEYDPVDHGSFLKYYALSATSDRLRSRFNDALYICRRYSDSISIVGRMNCFRITADNIVTKIKIDDTERLRILIEEFGISEEAAHALPPDDDQGFSLA